MRHQAATHRHHRLRSMGRPICVLAVATLFFTACAGAPDRVVTEGYFEGETQTQVTPAQTFRDAQSETELPLCSDIYLPDALEEPRQFVPDAAPVDPPSARHGRNTITIEYAPQGASNSAAIRIFQSDGSAMSVVHTVPSMSSAQAPPWLNTSVRVQNIVVTAERWLMPVTETSRVQFSHFLPGDIAHDAISVYAVRPSVRGVDRLHGLTFSGSYSESELDPVGFDCFWPWERMSVTPKALALTARQMELGDDVRLISDYILTARWGEAPTRTKEPGWAHGCCDIRVVDAGLVAIAHGVPPWYPERYDVCPYASDCYPVLHYSSDGLTWRVVDLPTRYVGSNPYSGHDDFELPIWVCSVESTATSVVIREAIEFDDAWWLYNGYGDDYPGLDVCNEVTYWTADGDLTNWRKLLAPPP